MLRGLGVVLLFFILINSSNFCQLSGTGPAGGSCQTVGGGVGVVQSRMG